MQAARDAISAMIDWTCATTQMSTVDAYMLYSVPGNVHRSESFDVPNWWSVLFPKFSPVIASTQYSEVMGKFGYLCRLYRDILYRVILSVCFCLGGLV